MRHPIKDFVFEKHLNKLNKTDSLKDISQLRSFCHECKNNGRLFYSNRINDVNFRMYGIGESIFGSLSQRKSSIFYPSIEHGLILHNKVWTDVSDTMRPTAITFGDYRKNILLKDWGQPAFCVGPYIHYAKLYYNDDELLSIKKQLGRNLLVIPSHTTDASGEISYKDKELVDYVLQIKNQYDSITVCAFWWNLDSKLVEMLNENGCKIVCAGHREDINFLSRLKTTIYLSDEVLGNGMGTHIGYCVYMNKPFHHIIDNVNDGICVDKSIKDIEAIEKHSEVILNAFKTRTTELSAEQKYCYDYYWGGQNIKSNEQIKAIYDINRDILRISKGNATKYKYATKQLVERFNKSENSYEILKLKLLRESLDIGNKI